jgi:DNA-binding transcriptional MocR family regulator
MPTAAAQARFSQRLNDLEASPIREILSVIQRPGMISFAGGLPAPESFPAVDLARVPAASLQYGASEGDPELRRAIAEHLAEIGLDCSPAQVLVLSGSQQGIDLVGKLFIDAGTPVAVESPTYLAALQVFRYFGATFTPLDPTLPAAGLAQSPHPAFAYAIPTFQNPTGRCYDAGQREHLAAACDALMVPLFEDDPYRDLAYDDCERRPVCARLKRASWIYQGSFSKSLAPGLRLGYLVASPDLMPYLVRLKQAADLHSNRLSQWYVLEQLRDSGRQGRIAGIVDMYRRKRDLFAEGLTRHFGGLGQWAVPPGGLFFWLELARQIDTRQLLPKAIERGVAFMPGESFFAGRPEACGALRLNFSHADAGQTERGLAILAELVGEALAAA